MAEILGLGTGDEIGAGFQRVVDEQHIGLGLDVGKGLFDIFHRYGDLTGAVDPLGVEGDGLSSCGRSNLLDMKTRDLL